MKKALTDLSLSGFLFLILIAFALQLPSVPDEARMYPLIILIGSAGLTMAVFIRALQDFRKEEYLTSEKCAQVINILKFISIYIVFTAIYIFLINKIGYILSTVLFCVVSLIYLRGSSKKVIILLPLILTLLVYFAFTRFLMVGLPQGTWFQFYL